MSGGSWDYVYGRFNDVAESLAHSSDPRRRALAKIVAKVGKAMHDIEWVDSNDYGPDGADEAIDAALGEDGPALVLAEVLEEAKRVAVQLAEAIQAEEGGPR